MYFPRELWNIIYHYSDPKTLTNLILNKQFYDELNQSSFWKLYIKDLLIEPVDYNYGYEWVKELNYINYIYQFYNQLNNTSGRCQYTIKHGHRQGQLCMDMHCPHQNQEGIICKGKVIYHIKHMNVDKITFFKNTFSNYLGKYNLVIYPSRYVSIEFNDNQLYFTQMSEKYLKLLLYQIIKYRK